MNIRKDIIWRIYLAFLAVCLFGMVILFQAFRIQSYQGEYLRSLADSLTTDYISIEAERGNVLSQDGRLLATSLPFFEIRVDLNSEALTDNVFYQNIDSLAYCLARFKGDKSKAAYKKLLINARRSGNRYFLIESNVTYPQLQEMKSWPLFRLGRYKGGLIVIQKNKRVMPFKMLAHRTIGYVREDVLPVGLEGSFDEQLAGVKGKRLMQRIAGGTWIPVNDEDEIRSKNGMDVVTNIDINLQDVAENALLKAIEKHRADHGTVVVMEVKTGKIKAIANIGVTADDKYWEKYNYAVGEATEPGSTLKLAAMIALLEDKYVDINDSVDLEKGVKEYHNTKMLDSEDHDYRNVTIQRAFEISSNVGISKLVTQYYGHQPLKYVERLYEMGLDKKVDIEVKGEAAPFIKRPGEKDWSGISLPWMSVGYAMTMTPLQILTFYNAIANNGTMMQPYLVDEIQQYGETVTKFKPRVINNKICSDKTLANVRALLEGVVESGTAMHLKSSNYRFAGKTGTAKIADNNLGYNYKRIYQSSFVGYFPADEPVYSCIVSIYAPTNGVYYGGYVAGPVFKEIADNVYSHSIEMHKQSNLREQFHADVLPGMKSGYKMDAKTIYDLMGVSCNYSHHSEWVYSVKHHNSINLMEREVASGIVPDVRGMGLRDALYLLENQGLVVRFSGKGKVNAQSIKYGTKVTKGREIKIELS